MKRVLLSALAVVAVWLVAGNDAKAHNGTHPGSHGSHHHHTQVHYGHGHVYTYRPVYYPRPVYPVTPYVYPPSVYLPTPVSAPQYVYPPYVLPYGQCH